MNEVIEIVRISIVEMLQIFLGISKSTFINLTTETIVPMNKTGNETFYNQVTKLSSRNYLVGNSYEDRVIVNEVKEGLEPTFESQSLSGKEHYQDSKCVLIDTKTHEKFYLMVELFDEIKPVVEYRFNGNPIDRQMFESFMRKMSDNKSQPQERKVKVITPLLTSIKGFSINGFKYEVE